MSWLADRLNSERERRARLAARAAARQVADTPIDVALVPAHTGEEGPAPLPVALDQRAVRRAALTVIGLATAWLVAFYTFSMVRHFLFLLLLAWLLAIAMEPMIGWLVRRGMGRGVSTAITGIGAILAALALVGVFGSEFVNQITVLIQTLPQVVTDSVAWVNHTFHTSFDANAVLASLKVTPERVATWASDFGGGALTLVGSLASVLFDLITVVVFTFYFAGAGPRALRAVSVWMPPARQRVVGTVWEIVASKTGGYVISKAELAGLSAVVHGIFFWAIGLDAWLPMALLVGITAQFVPVVGTYIGVAIPVLIALIGEPIDAVFIIVFALFYQQVETYFFTPRISRRTMDVNPAIALAAVFIGAEIWGPIGALIGIPLAAAIVAIFETYARRYEVVNEIEDTEAAPPEGEPPSTPPEVPGGPPAEAVEEAPGSDEPEPAVVPTAAAVTPAGASPAEAPAAQAPQPGAAADPPESPVADADRVAAGRSTGPS